MILEASMQEGTCLSVCSQSVFWPPDDMIWQGWKDRERIDRRTEVAVVQERDGAGLAIGPTLQVSGSL